MKQLFNDLINLFNGNMGLKVSKENRYYQKLKHMSKRQLMRECLRNKFNA